MVLLGFSQVLGSSYLFQGYRKLDPFILRFIAAEFFIQLMNSAWQLIYNFYLLDLGYSDTEIANFISARFILVILLSLPLGLWLSKRQIFPLIRWGMLAITFAAIVSLFATIRKWEVLMTISLVVFGGGFSLLQIGIIPWLIRVAPPKQQPEAIALHFASWSTAAFLMGLTLWSIHWLETWQMSKPFILGTATLLGFIGFLVLPKQVMQEAIQPQEHTKSTIMEDFSWRKNTVAIVPQFILSLGAGLTIPYISLFFHAEFQMPWHDFALMGALTTLLVASASMASPIIRLKYGYTGAILGTQTLGVLALVAMGFTSNLANGTLAMILAISLNMIRQPLFNMSWPVIAEFTMTFVGKKNHVITSALRSTIWGLSFFISARLFILLREQGLSYGEVFIITGVINTIGIGGYQYLISIWKRSEPKTADNAALI